MKKILSYLFVAVLVFSTACEKEKIEEVPGNIPGMGNAPGELQVDPFEFPEDIEFIGNASGFDGSTIAVQGNASLKSTYASKTVQSFCNYGSGGHFVKLQITVKNTNPTAKRTLFFPPGLIFKINLADYQNAILLDWIWTCIQPGQTKTFVVHLYCVNLGKKGSEANLEYEIIGVTSSLEMWRLLHMVHWHKINWEHYNSNVEISKAKLKANGNPSYEEIADVLQDAVWAITNGSGLTQEQIEFIESIPMLEEGTYPKSLDDKTVEPPYYFEEYTPVQ
ncbi:MAG: hypothetical protein JEZ14_05375 [Marinilabiliaceae bacterium]|nr:hypothetical protein [Marinilabiliaceae bacterium]